MKQRTSQKEGRHIGFTTIFSKGSPAMKVYKITVVCKVDMLGLQRFLVHTFFYILKAYFASQLFTQKERVRQDLYVVRRMRESEVP